MDELKAVEFGDAGAMPEMLRARVRRRRVAHRVRQDLWRVLQVLRGFAPVVQVERTTTGLEVTAGGQVAGAFCRAHAEGKIRAVLDDPRNRER